MGLWPHRLALVYGQSVLALATPPGGFSLGPLASLQTVPLSAHIQKRDVLSAHEQGGRPQKSIRSGATRSTSSMVVIPAATFSAPLSRKGRMPSLMA